MDCENCNARSPRLHAVCVPLPAQSHIMALMNFAELLSDRGIFITFVNTEWIEERVKRASKNVRRPKFRFLSFPDGLPPDHGRTSRLELAEMLAAVQRSGAALEHVLRTNVISVDVPPVTCIVTDSFMSCTLSVAQNMGLPRVQFWPLCAASSIGQKYAHLLKSQGHLPAKVSEAKRTEKLLTSLPGNIPPLWPTDLLSFYREKEDLMFSVFLYESQVQNKGADFVLVNTFEELEGKDAATALSVNGCPALAVGPVFLPNFLQGKGSNSTMNMWEEDQTCLQWLDAQKPGSVLYVSFGSIALNSQKQLEEIALGLENSGQPFLWVHRPDLLQGESTILPDGFKERTKDRGLLVSWSPQLRVLNHASVGGFLTHGGWNSILETISMGVPVIGWPHFADQFLDCRFAKEVWKMGIDFDGLEVDEKGLVGRDEVESFVRRLMQTSQGEELRKKARELKEAAIKSVMPGGKSSTNMNTFIKYMKEIATSRGMFNGRTAYETDIPPCVTCRDK